MGDMAEYYQELAEQDKLGLSYGTRPLSEHSWVTQDLKTIAICDMDTSHIRYSIAKCKRDRWRLEMIPYLELELNKRKHHDR